MRFLNSIQEKINLKVLASHFLVLETTIIYNLNSFTPVAFLGSVRKLNGKAVKWRSGNLNPLLIVDPRL